MLQYPEGDAPEPDRPDSPQSSSSSHSDLSSPSFNRDSDLDFASRTKDEIQTTIKKVAFESIYKVDRISENFIIKSRKLTAQNDSSGSFNIPLLISHLSN